MTDIDATELQRLMSEEHEVGEIGSEQWWALAHAAIHALPSLLAEVDRLTTFYSSLVAEAFDNGSAAERARLRAAVEGLPIGWGAVNRAAVLAAIEGADR
jgi:hypothetical protein